MASSVSSVSPVNDLVASILNKFDTNKDGKLSTDEFGAFLTNLVSGLSPTAKSTAGTTSSATATATASASASAASSAASSGSARARVGKLAGFDMVKLDDTANKSFKYQIGRILQFYPNTPAGLQEALPEIQKIVPGAKISGSKGDVLDFGDYIDPKSGKIGAVDVILSAGTGGVAWTWQPIDA